MSQILLVALGASLPLALLAFAAAWAVEAMGADVRLRLCAWTAALLLPALPTPAMLAIHALDIPSPFAVMRVPEAAPPAVLALPANAAAMAPAPLPAPRLPLVALALGLLGAGAALRLAQLALGLRRVARLKAASEPISDPHMAAQLGRGVRLADTETPVLAGLIRPTILLPRRLLGGLSAEQAILVCAHERAHLAAGDHITHLLEETMVRLFWFNPFMAAVRERLAAAREEAADLRALDGADAGHRREYARTLLAALRLAGRAEPVAAFTGFRRQGAERRLKAILKPTGPGTWRAGAVAVLAGLGLATAVGGFSLAVAAEPRSNSDIAAAPASPAAAAAPAPAAHPQRPHTMIVYRDNGGGHPHAKVDGHAVVINGDDWDVDSDALRGLSPEEKARLKADLKTAHEEMAKAMAESHAAMAGAHKELIYKFEGLSDEEQTKVHQAVEKAMTQAHAAMATAHQVMAQNDGRVLMRCKLGPDGKAQDCEALHGPVSFQLFHEGHAGDGLPPLPPMPPMPPAPPTPPAPPAAG